MPYSLGFLSVDPIRRRMARASNSVSPGFPAIIVTINETAKTCDLWVEGSLYTLKGVNYSTSIEKKPDYIKVGSSVYVRHAHGNKFELEIEGPSHVIPTVKAGSTILPPQNGLPDMIMDGLEVRQSVYPGKTVSITTGHARLAGLVYTFPEAVVGENLNAKVTGAAPGVMKVGYGDKLNGTYLYFPVPNNSSTVNYRYDQIEMGLDRIVDYIQGVAAPIPLLTTPQNGHYVLGTILVRPSFTRILSSDINAPFLGFTFISVVPQALTIPVAGGPVTVTCYTYDQNGNRSAGLWITPSLRDAQIQPVSNPAIYGSISPAGGAAVDATGQVSFVYDPTGATNSTYIIFLTASGSFASVIVTLTDASGNPLPH